MKLGADYKQIGFIKWAENMNRSAWIAEARSHGRIVVERGDYATIHDPKQPIA